MKIKRWIAFLMGALVLLAVCNANSFTQDKSDKDSVKLRAELVQIDVLVIDSNQKSVSGLKREDFELSDNGKPQTITNFVYEESATNKAAPGGAATPSVPRALAAGEVKRILAFVVDTLHMKPENIYSMRNLLTDFVDNQLAPGDLVLILPTAGGSGLLQQFTSDRRLLKQAINRLHPVYFTNDITPRRTLESRNPSINRRGEDRGIGLAGGLSMPDVGIANNSRNVDPLELADVRSTLRTIDDMCRAMSKVSGRKLGVIVSEGLRFYATSTEPDLQNTLALAARSNVVFYSFDPRGLTPLVPDASDNLGALATATGSSIAIVGERARDSKRADFFESQESLKRMAAETGGSFFGNNNDIKRGLDHLLEENAAYYMLGFQPEGRAWDGKFHKIKVAVRNRPDLTVTYRKGYVAKSEKPAAQISTNPNVAEALEAITSPFARRDIDLRLTPLYLFDAQNEPVVTGLVHIDASKLHFKQENGNYKALLDQVGYIYDINGKAVDQFADQLALDLKPETYQNALKRGLLSMRKLNLSPGLYQIRLFIRDTETRLIGTANDFFAIPNVKSGNLAMSSVYMHGAALKDGKVVPAAAEGSTLSQRHFQKGSIFSYEVVIYNAKGDEKTSQPQLEMQARVLLGNKVVFASAVKPIAVDPSIKAGTPLMVSRSFQLGSLAPDEYTLEVVVFDRLRKKDALIRQETDFTID